MANNKVYSRAEMQEAGIVTCDYAFMDKPGEYIGTPVFWWQGYLGFYEMDNGTRLRLVYGQSSKGSTYLKQIEKL